MPMIDQKSGCKVGWEIYDNETDAMAAAQRAGKEAVRKAEQGYDFGYQWPGSIKRLDEHPDYEGKTVWVVVTP